MGNLLRWFHLLTHLQPSNQPTNQPPRGFSIVSFDFSKKHIEAQHTENEPRIVFFGRMSDSFVGGPWQRGLSWCSVVRTDYSPVDSVDEMFFGGFLGLSWCLFWCFFAFSSSRCLVHFFVKGFGKKKHVGPVSWFVWQHSLCRGWFFWDTNTYYMQ